MRKDIVWGQEVPAEDLIGQCEVALENGRHLSVEVFPAAELLQHLHGQHEDLTQAVLLVRMKTVAFQKRHACSRGKKEQ